MNARSPTRRRLQLTICSNGVPWSTSDFSGDTTVNDVVTAAVEYFAGQGQRVPSEFTLALVVYGYANPPLDNNATLADGHVTNGSLLTLVRRDPERFDATVGAPDRRQQGSRSRCGGDDSRLSRGQR